MPFPVATAITAGAGILGNIIGAVNQRKANQREEAYADKQYNRSRADSLADYHMQNEYNSPQAQMQRLRAAGLNPNLIYGDGANTPSATVRGSDSGSYKPQAYMPDYSFVGGALSAGVDLDIKNAQRSNILEQTENLKTERILKAAQTVGEMARTESSWIDNDTKQQVQQYQVEAAKLALSKMQADIDSSIANTNFTVAEGQRKLELHEGNLQEQIYRIYQQELTAAKTDAERRQIEEAIKLIQTDTRLKQLDEDLKKQGIQPGDPMWMRVIYRQAERIRKLVRKIY